MVKKCPKQNKFPSQKRNKCCKLCKNKERKYSSSSLGRHIRTKHGQKYQCTFCLKKYTDKNNHKNCFIQEKYFLKYLLMKFKVIINIIFSHIFLIFQLNYQIFLSTIIIYFCVQNLN